MKTIVGSGGNDVLFDQFGDDTIDGGAGHDQVGLRGCAEDYWFTANADGSVTATSKIGEGTNLLCDIEAVFFTGSHEYYAIEDLC
ncbi:MAG: hypothetical protein AAGK38_12910 [Pseudomonadota bacterium]